MKASSFLLTLSLGVGALNAQDAQQIANSLNIPAKVSYQEAIPVPQVDGAKVSLFCVDYEHLVDKNGVIAHRPLSDTPLHVAYKVEKDGKSAISKDYVILLQGDGDTAPVEGANPKPKTVPAILQWQGATGEYKFGKKITIASPQLNETTQGILKRDFKEVLGAEVEFVAPFTEDADIHFGRTKTCWIGEEGYLLETTDKGVDIASETATGQMWGVRTLLQILKQTGGSMPCGTAYDTPRFKVRGFMLDIARMPIPMDTIKDVIRTMAWYKMNDLHLVINNNFIFHEDYVNKGRDPFKESYSAFRLESKAKGADGTPLTAQDLYYTKKDFMELVEFAKAYGVHIVPEFDTPGHALSFTRLRPDLIYQGKMHAEKRRCEMLDAANPETLKFVGGIFDEFLLKDQDLGGKAVFGDCPVVHVGSDEFFGDTEDYRKYVDGILRYIMNRGYTPRIWGSLNQKRGNIPITAKGAQMNLWNGHWGKAWDSIDHGFDVINTNDGALYIVPYAKYYRVDKCNQWLYDNFHTNNIGGEVLPAGHPQLLGATFAVWQDMTDLEYNGYCMYDIWRGIQNTMDVVCEKVWSEDKNALPFAEHRKLAESIGDAPGLEIHHKAPFEPLSVQPASLPMELGRPDLGPDYHLTMELTLDEAKDGEEQVLLSGPQGQLLATTADGTVGFRRADTILFSFGYKLPVGQKVKLEIIGRPGATQLLIDGQVVGQTCIKTFHDNTKNLVTTFILPLKTLGASFHGTIHSMKVESLPASPAPAEKPMR